MENIIDSHGGWGQVSHQQASSSPVPRTWPTDTRTKLSVSGRTRTKLLNFSHLERQILEPNYRDDTCFLKQFPGQVVQQICPLQVIADLHHSTTKYNRVRKITRDRRCGPRSPVDRVPAFQYTTAGLSSE